MISPEIEERIRHCVKYGRCTREGKLVGKMKPVFKMSAIRHEA